MILAQCNTGRRQLSSRNQVLNPKTDVAILAVAFRNFQPDILEKCHKFFAADESEQDKSFNF